MNKLFWLLLLVVACAPVQEPAQELAPSIAEEPVSAPVVAPKVQPKVQVEQIPEQVEPISGVEKCLQLGCPLGSSLIGDRKTDLYYACYCTFVRWIKPGDLLCFSSETEAAERGYRKAQSC